MFSKKRSVFFVFFAALLIKFCVIDFLYVSGPSMKPSISSGEFVVLYKLAYGFVNPFTNRTIINWALPKKGEVIVFSHQNKNEVKRCVWVSKKINSANTLDFFNDSIYTVYVMGDNGEESIDSRNYGEIRLNTVLGKVLWK